MEEKEKEGEQNHGDNAGAGIITVVIADDDHDDAGGVH